MDTNIKKMYQAILNDQKSLQTEIIMMCEKMQKSIQELEIKVSSGFEGLNKKLDDFDARIVRFRHNHPTRKEWNELVERVEKIEHKLQ
jgi:hypothetical protein